MCDKDYGFYVSFQHSGHTFKPIDNEYDEHVHKVMDDLGLLKRRHTELISLVQDVVRTILCFNMSCVM